MSNDWGTPQALVNLLNDEFGFTIDVCASPENAKVGRFFGPPGCGGGRWHMNGLFWCIAEDGLAQSWRGKTFWMNPPFSDLPKWIGKASTPGLRGVGLLKVDTSTLWWRRVADTAKEIRFMKRIRFVGADQTCNFATALVVWDGRGGKGGPRYSYMELPPEALGRKTKDEDQLKRIFADTRYAL